MLLEAVPPSFGFYYKMGFSFLYSKRNLDHLPAYESQFSVKFNIDDLRKQIELKEDDSQIIRENYNDLQELEKKKIIPLLMFYDFLEK